MSGAASAGRLAWGTLATDAHTHSVQTHGQHRRLTRSRANEAHAEQTAAKQHGRGIASSSRTVVISDVLDLGFESNSVIRIRLAVRGESVRDKPSNRHASRIYANVHRTTQSTSLCCSTQDLQLSRWWPRNLQVTTGWCMTSRTVFRRHP